MNPSERAAMAAPGADARTWTARLLLVAVAASGLVALPPMTGGASAAPTDSAVRDLAEVPVERTVPGRVVADTAADEAGGLDAAAAGPRSGDAPGASAPGGSGQAGQAGQSAAGAEAFGADAPDAEAADPAPDADGDAAFDAADAPEAPDAEAAGGEGEVERPGRRVEWAELAPMDAGDAVMVGVEAPEGTSPEVEVRSEIDGEWSPWTPLDYPTVYDGPDEGTEEAAGERNATEPAWVGEVDRVQVRAETGEVDPADLDLHTVEIEGSTEFDPTDTGVGAANAAQGLDVIPREAWDPNNDCAPRSSPTVRRDVEFAVIHHTASTNSYSWGQAASQLRSMCLYHRNSNGWSDLGYNIAVDRFGRVYEGRAGGLERAVQGAHASGFNDGSVGITVMGCFDTGGACAGRGDTAITSAARRAVDRVVAWKFAIHGVNPTGRVSTDGRTIPTIVGHRDVGQTSCPGNRFYPYVQSMGDRVEDLMDRYDPWPEAEAGQYGGSDGLATFSPTTGNVLVADPERGSFRVAPWSTHVTPHGWRHHVTGDFTGDGHDEVASLHKSGYWWVGGSKGDRFEAPKHWDRWKTVSGWQDLLIDDFSGDGRDDIAAFHDNGTWWVAESTGDGFETSQWGEYVTTSGWEHRVADVDGNERADVLSYHSSNGRWYALMSKGASRLDDVGDRFEYERFTRYRTRTGWQDHLVGDFTGDGRTDLASYHPSNGTWWVSENRVTGVDLQRWDRFRTRTGWQDHLVGDLDGDGQDDVVSYHPRSGSWWASLAGYDGFDGEQWMQFGTNRGWTRHEIADVDGDGRDDVASYHGRLRGWWVSQSAGDGFRTARW